MSTINIGRDNADASYRYKMPRLITKVEGRGNGIKTVIVNMTDIAKALHVDPAYPTKYFGIELGAQSKYDEKTERAVVNGSHNAPDLAKMLEKFVEKFILCPTCKLPEIKMEVKKDKVVIDCAACGYNGVVPDTHKLVSYIVKDHKDTSADKEKKKGDKKAKDKDGKKEDKEKEKDKKKKEDSEEDGEEEKEREVEWFTDTSKEAQKQRKEAEFGAAIRAAKETPAAVKEAKTDTPVGILQLFLSSERSTEEVVAEVKRLQLARGLDEPQKVKVLLEAAIDVKQGLAAVPKQYKDRAKILRKFATDRASAGILIGCIEEQVGVVEPKLLPKIPMILQVLYEQEVLDEETITAWADSPPESSWLVNKDVATKVRKHAQPFITWLKTAEEDDD